MDEPSDDDLIDPAEALAARDEHIELEVRDLISVGIGYLSNLQYFAIGLLAVGIVMSGTRIFSDETRPKVGAPLIPDDLQPTFRLPAEASKFKSRGASADDNSAVRVVPEDRVRPMPPTNVRVE